MSKTHRWAILSLILLLTTPSCVYHRQLVNFRDNGERVVPPAPVEILNQAEPKIQPSDVLHIQVNSFDDEAAQPFNRMRSGPNNQLFFGNQQGMSAQNLFGYMVGYDGFIDFPVLGQVAVGGLSLTEARNLLVTLIRPYLSDAVVNVQFLNFKFTVLGEVNRPMTYNAPNPRITILEAVGMAGDMTLYADRTTVLVIREVNGIREYGTVDLQGPELFASPYFYLRQNDVIYIEPLPQRIATVADPAQRIIGYITAGLSIVSIVLALTVR